MPKSFEASEKAKGTSQTKNKPIKQGYGVGKTKSVNKRIRDIQRLLQKKGDVMPEDIKEAKAKELEELQSKAQSREKSERERKTVVRYRMLKFIERQKLARKIKHAESQLAEETLGSKEKNAIEAELNQLKDDLLYIAPYRNPHAKERQEKLRKEIAAKHQKEKANIINGVIKVAGDEEDEKEFKHLEDEPSKKSKAGFSQSPKPKAANEIQKEKKPQEPIQESNSQEQKKKPPVKGSSKVKPSEKEKAKSAEPKSGWNVSPSGPKGELKSKMNQFDLKTNVSGKRTRDSSSSSESSDNSEDHTKKRRIAMDDFFKG